MPVSHLHISPQCEAGIRFTVDGRKVDYHEQCDGRFGKHLSGRYRCMCWCHSAKPGRDKQG